MENFVTETREELGATLDEIEHRLRPDVMSKKLMAWMSESFQKDSTPWLVAIGLAVLGAFAAILWAILGDD